MDPSTFDVPLPSPSLEAWGDMLDRTLMPIQIVPAGELQFRVEVDSHSLDGLSVVNVAGAGCEALRGCYEVARTTQHFYLASMNVAGPGVLSCKNEEKQLARGDIFLIDTMNPMKLSLAEPYHHLLIRIPKPIFDRHLLRPDEFCGSVVSHRDPLARLYASYLVTGFQMADKLSSSASRMFSQHLLDLLCHALTGGQAESLGSSATRHAALFIRAQRAISINLSSPTLGPDVIAKQVGVSTRSLHRLFGEQGETVMNYVQKERIDSATTMLASPREQDKSITEIAFACGFNDVTHFGRVFASRTGASPSEWRRKQLGRTKWADYREPLVHAPHIS
jgi:AraC-like DNA-binding protein